MTIRRTLILSIACTLALTGPAGALTLLEDASGEHGRQLRVAVDEGQGYLRVTQGTVTVNGTPVTGDPSPFPDEPRSWRGFPTTYLLAIDGNGSLLLADGASGLVVEIDRGSGGGGDGSAGNTTVGNATAGETNEAGGESAEAEEAPDPGTSAGAAEARPPSTEAPAESPQQPGALTENPTAHREPGLLWGLAGTLALLAALLAAPVWRRARQLRWLVRRLRRRVRRGPRNS